MKMEKSISGILVTLALICNVAWAGVALDEKFETDLSKWIILDEPNHPELNQVVNVALAGGSLQVDCNLNERFRYQGVQSKEAFTLPSGGKLVVDFYGNNSRFATGWMYPGSSHSFPFWTVASYESTGTFRTGEPYIDVETEGWFSVKGWDSYWGDWVMWNRMPGVYQNIEVVNPAEPPVPPTISLTAEGFTHVIMEIDAANIRVYIGGDYYENLSSPTALYTIDTPSLFTSAQLTQGLFFYSLAARYTSWYNSTVGERFDGVKVTRVGATAPMNCYEAADMGYVANVDADVNKDCHFDFTDLAILAQDWLKCVEPANSNCAKPWL